MSVCFGLSLSCGMLPANFWWSWAIQSYNRERHQCGWQLCVQCGDTRGIWLAGFTLRPFHWEIMKSHYLEDELVNVFQWRILQSSTQGTYTWQSLSGNGVMEGVWQRAPILTCKLTLDFPIFSQAAAPLLLLQSLNLEVLCFNLSTEKNPLVSCRDTVPWLNGIKRGSRVVISPHIFFNQFPSV